MNPQPLNPVRSLTIVDLRLQAETLGSLSLRHLSAATRLKLADNALTVAAYPTDCAGFVQVGRPGQRMPTEPELARVLVAAEAAGISWLTFEQDAAVIDGLAVFDDRAGGS